jgi:hypothetical protein
MDEQASLSSVSRLYILSEDFGAQTDRGELAASQELPLDLMLAVRTLDAKARYMLCWHATVTMCADAEEDVFRRTPDFPRLWFWQAGCITWKQHLRDGGYNGQANAPGTSSADYPFS